MEKGPRARASCCDRLDRRQKAGSNVKRSSDPRNDERPVSATAALQRPNTSGCNQSEPVARTASAKGSSGPKPPDEEMPDSQRERTVDPYRSNFPTMLKTLTTISCNPRSIPLQAQRIVGRLCDGHSQKHALCTAHIRCGPLPECRLTFINYRGNVLPCQSHSPN
mgnify:CR=1 FL=1